MAGPGENASPGRSRRNGVQDIRAAPSPAADCSCESRSSHAGDDNPGGGTRPLPDTTSHDVMGEARGKTEAGLEPHAAGHLLFASSETRSAARWTVAPADEPGVLLFANAGPRNLLPRERSGVPQISRAGLRSPQRRDPLSAAESSHPAHDRFRLSAAAELVIELATMQSRGSARIGGPADDRTRPESLAGRRRGGRALAADPARGRRNVADAGYRAAEDADRARRCPRRGVRLRGGECYALSSSVGLRATSANTSSARMRPRLSTIAAAASGESSSRSTIARDSQ